MTRDNDRPTRPYELFVGDERPQLEEGCQHKVYISSSKCILLFGFCQAEFEAASDFRLQPGECQPVHACVLPDLGGPLPLTPREARLLTILEPLLRLDRIAAPSDLINEAERRCAAAKRDLVALNEECQVPMIDQLKAAFPAFEVREKISELWPSGYELWPKDDRPKIY